MRLFVRVRMCVVYGNALAAGDAEQAGAARVKSAFAFGGVHVLHLCVRVCTGCRNALAGRCAE